MKRASQRSKDGERFTNAQQKVKKYIFYDEHDAHHNTVRRFKNLSVLDKDADVVNWQYMKQTELN